MQLWPIHPKPRPDELLSSWLMRIAIRSGSDLKTLCKQLLESEHGTPREIDRVYSTILIQKVAEGTGQSQDIVQTSTLAHDEGYVYLNRGYGMNQWIFPTTVFDKMTHNGLAYCPDCLAKDAEPYYRKSWRYSFNPVCPVHRRFLRQACPSCKAPFIYFTTDTIPNERIMHHCLQCGHCLSDWPTESADPELLDRLVGIQLALAEGIARNTFYLQNCGAVSALTYLQILHTLTYAMRLPKWAAWVLANYQDVPVNLSLAPLERDHETLPLEMRSPEAIGTSLCLASTLIVDWPASVIKLNKIGALPYRNLAVIQDFSLTVLHSLQDILPKRMIKVSNEEMENARRLLRKKLGRKETSQEMRAFMEDGHATARTTISPVKQAEYQLSAGKFELGNSPKTKVKGPQAKDREYTRKLINMSADDIAKIAVLRKSRVLDNINPEKPKQLGLFED
jgi:hypothetical protein